MATGAMTMVGDSQIPQISNISTVELAGQILGDAGDALATLDAKLAGADFMIGFANSF